MPAWIARGGYDFVWYAEVNRITCRSAACDYHCGRSAGKDTLRATGWRCRQTESDVHGAGQTPDVYRRTGGQRTLGFTA